jgi:very-short-patch-repair endonuclease
MATIDVRAAAVAIHGIAADRHLVSGGVSARAIRRRVADGVWPRPGPRVVRLWEADLTLQAIVAAVRSGPEATLASHTTAAWLHDIGGFAAPDVPHVTIPRGLRYLDWAGAVVHTTIRDVAEPAVVEGIPVTPVARTLRALAASRGVSRRMLHRAVRDALRDGMATVEEILAEAEPRGHGRRRLREAVELERTTAFQRTDSRLERAWSDALREAGLTGFTTQHEVVGADRHVRLDIAWPDLRVAVEVDGARFHADALAATADEERTAWLERRGWTVIRVTAADLRRDRLPLAISEIRATLATSR